MKINTLKIVCLILLLASLVFAPWDIHSGYIDKIRLAPIVAPPNVMDTSLNVAVLLFEWAFIAAVYFVGRSMIDDKSAE